MVAGDSRHVLVTGGAGFVGGNLAVALAERHPDWRITAVDNLKRRGSELNLQRLRQAGVAFEHADVRELGDLLGLERVDALVECSAEPSVLGPAGYAVQANLVGAFNCFELARRDGAQVVFLSTSRVYPMGPLNELRLEEAETRFELADHPKGISEAFPLAGARTVYGATKLAAELLLEEYRDSYGIPAVVNRFGVIAGPWQMGKVDQGVFTYWMLAHFYRRPLTYIGYGGEGKQVRDLVHVDDAIDLIDEQLSDPARWDGVVANAGGGREVSLSLREATALCEEITGNRVEVASDPETRKGDVPVYISDCSRLFAHTDWRPRRAAREVLVDSFEWIRENEQALSAALG